MDLLDRLHARLLESLADLSDSGPQAPAPTVADVYQRLIPYRAIRGELGIMELAEYEHALLRLLAGERRYLTLDDDEARAELLTELESSNPILGVYRDYSSCIVRIVDGGAPADPAPLTPIPLLTPIPHPDGAASVDEVPEVDEVPALGAPPRRCSHCAADLPNESDLQFCPVCGGDQREPPCMQCGSRLREEWRFCIRCGTPRAGVPPRT